VSLSRYEVEGKFGSVLKCYLVMPEDEVKATIVVFHGMGEHKERYMHFAKWMAKEGFAVVAYDHRKHGESIGELDTVGIFTDSDRFEYVIDDAHYVVKNARSRVKDKPIIVLGHSMGSIIARRYIAKYTALPIGAVIMGTLPIYKKAQAIAPLLIANVINLFHKNKPSPFMAKLLNQPLLKSIENPVTEFDWLSYEEKNIEKYIEDPLCGYPYSPKFYIEFFKEIVEVNRTVNISETREIPILFISGKDDPVGNFGQGVKDVEQQYNGHGFFELKIVLLDNMRHEVLNEKKKLIAYKEIRDWCESILN
jgi:alpha-beta hydrolase superfamily lysophospholipase